MRFRKEWQIHLGDQLDHYRLDSVVSRNNMETVFRGTDLRTNHSVAIKVPHPGMEIDPTFLDRFHREEEIGKTLNHPGLIKVLNHDDHSQTYLVTEWFDGKPLREILTTKKRLPPERAVRITLAVCDALGYVHGHGIVHRDLRPENILVDGEDRIKLIDFRLAAKEGAARITFTNLAQLVGSSPYISPEELKGTRGDARSDIYALGVILYEMLTGRVPFPGRDPFERLTQHPVPPRDVEPSISPQLQEVIYRALEREHKNRYPNAHEFAVDLAHLDRVGLNDRAELRKERNRAPANPKRVALYAALALIPAAIFGLLLYFSHH